MRTRAAIVMLIALATQAVAAGSSEDLFANTTSRAVIRPISGMPGGSTTDLVGLLKSNGLFDSARLQSWQSYSFQVTSGGGQTSSAGLLVQHLQYQISKPLTMYMEIGVLHDPLSMAGISRSRTSQTASVTIPAFDLIYRPTDNMVFQLHYSQVSDPWGTGQYGAFSPLRYGNGLQ